MYTLEQTKIIFVVDDDPDVLVSLRFLLETEGFTVKTFTNGSELLSSDFSLTADCLVIDYMMAGMNGLQLAKEIRDRQISTPIIIMTVYEAAIAKAAAIGIRHVILKPHVQENLIAYIQSVMQGNIQSKSTSP